MIGGTGFIGRHVATLLAAQGHDVAVLHRGLHPGDLPARVRHLYAETAAIPVLRFPNEARRLAPDVVLHMVLVGQRDAEAVVRGFRGVARRLVAISSGDVYRAYGRLIGTEPAVSAQRRLLSEDAPLRERLYPYGRAVDSPWGTLRDYDKIPVETIVLGEPQLPGTILRLSKVYGVGDGAHTFFPYIRRFADERPVVLLGAAQARWRWTHGYVENVAAAIALAAIDDRAMGRVYNVGEEPTPSVAERIRALGRAARWSGEVVAVPDERLPQHLRAHGGNLDYSADLAYDTSRIRSELGYLEPVSPEEALSRTVEWERTHPPDVVDRAGFDYPAEDAALRGR